MWDKKMILRILLTILVLAFSLQLTGCMTLRKGAAVGKRGMTWVVEKFKQTVNSPLIKFVKPLKPF